MNDTNIAEKVASITSTLQYLKEQLPAMLKTISDISSTSVVHTTLIEVITKNLEKLSKNVDELITIQYKVNTSSDEIDVIGESLSKIKEDISAIQRNCELRKFTCDACVKPKETKSSWMEWFKLVPAALAITAFISSISWYIIKVKLIEILPDIIKTLK